MRCRRREVTDGEESFTASVRHASRHTLNLPGRQGHSELEVLELIAEGLSNAEIAAALFITPETVKTYVSRILTDD